MKPEVVIAALLAVGVMASATAVIYATHLTRARFAQLQDLQRERDVLNVEWERLQLEQGTYATHGRIERIAREELEMRLPQRDEVVMVKLPKGGGDDHR